MAVRIVCVFVLIFAAKVHTIDSFESAGVRVAVRVLDECINSDGFSTCIKKKALTFLNRLGRVDKLPLTEGVVIVRAFDKPGTANFSEEELENSLPRSTDAHDVMLDNMLMEKLTSYVKSRTIQVTMPKLSELVDEGI